jgi:hypothetical protein
VLASSTLPPASCHRAAAERATTPLQDPTVTTPSSSYHCRIPLSPPSGYRIPPPPQNVDEPPLFFSLTVGPPLWCASAPSSLPDATLGSHWCLPAAPCHRATGECATAPLRAWTARGYRAVSAPGTCVPRRRPQAVFLLDRAARPRPTRLSDHCAWQDGAPRGLYPRPDWARHYAQI